MKIKFDKRYVILFVAIILAMLTLTHCNFSKVISIEVSYNGSTEEGVVLDENNTGFVITAKYEDGEEKDITNGWKVKEPKTLEADRESEVTITYKHVESICKVKCSTTKLKSIYAEYKGSTKKGTLIDESNTDIIVTGEYGNGTTEKLNGWKVKKSQVLVSGKTVTVDISYEDKECTLKVECPLKFGNVDEMIEGTHFTFNEKQFIKYFNDTYKARAIITDDTLTIGNNVKGYGITYDGEVKGVVRFENDSTGQYVETIEILSKNSATNGIMAFGVIFAECIDDSIIGNEHSILVQLLYQRIYEGSDIILTLGTLDKDKYDDLCIRPKEK